jgi:hypothetical protein
MEMELAVRSDRELIPALVAPDSSPVRIGEFLETLRRRRAYLVGEADERKRRGHRVDFETREINALTWALERLEREDGLR